MCYNHQRASRPVRLTGRVSFTGRIRMFLEDYGLVVFGLTIAAICAVIVGFILRQMDE